MFEHYAKRSVSALLAATLPKEDVLLYFNVTFYQVPLVNWRNG
jgi:hypothetical protein